MTMEGIRELLKIINKLKGPIKIGLVIYSLYKMNLLPENKSGELKRLIEGIEKRLMNKKEDYLGEYEEDILEELDLPFKIKVDKKHKWNIKVPAWMVNTFKIGIVPLRYIIKLRKENEASESDDQKDQKLVDSILEELKKLKK